MKTTTTNQEMFLVTNGLSYEFEIFGVFDSENLAELFIQKNEETDDEFIIQKFILNAPISDLIRTHRAYIVKISNENGSAYARIVREDNVFEFEHLSADELNPGDNKFNCIVVMATNEAQAIELAIIKSSKILEEHMYWEQRKPVYSQTHHENGNIHFNEKFINGGLVEQKEYSDKGELLIHKTYVNGIISGEIYFS